MGVPARVVVYAPTQAEGRVAAESAYARIAEIEWVLSDYRPGSELIQFPGRSAAAAGAWVSVSQDFATVLITARGVSEASGGAFDLTVGPAVALWRESRNTGKLPESGVLQEAVGLVGYGRVELRWEGGDAEARIVGPQADRVRLDAGGIGKGYAAEEAVAELKRSGFGRCMVAIAGDVSVGDAPLGKEGWEIGVAGWGRERGISETLLLTNCSVSTSGDAEQFVELVDWEGRVRRFSHIVDPRTGLGVEVRRAVTVVGRSGGGWVDAVAKVGTITGFERLAEVLGDRGAARCEEADLTGEMLAIRVGEMAWWRTSGK